MGGDANIAMLLTPMFAFNAKIVSISMDNIVGNAKKAALNAKMQLLALNAVLHMSFNQTVVSLVKETA